jgi:LysM domain.
MKTKLVFLAISWVITTGAIRSMQEPPHQPAGPNLSSQMQQRSQQSDILHLQAQLESQTEVIEALQRRVEDTLESAKLLVQNDVGEARKTSSTLEDKQKLILQDLTTLKTSLTTLQDLYQKLSLRTETLETLVATNTVNVAHLESALKLVFDALQLKDPKIALNDMTSALGSDKQYIVKEGDSLSKIAKAHFTSVKTIKDLNHLTKDTIVVGQKLIVPSP